MKTALLINYYWPPSGGAGVQRWLKMSRYMNQFGWKLVVYTPSNPDVPVEDLSLLAEIPEQLEVVTYPIWEPHGWYKLVTGRGRDSNVYSGFINESGERSTLDRLAIWIRGNLFIPDPRRFWVRPSVKRLDQLIRQRTFDSIVSTGPPHSMHLIAQKLAAKHQIPWVADFRDPWTGIDYYGELMLTGFADRRQHKLELSVLRSASRIVTVSPSWARDLGSLCDRDVDVITNGFDEQDFQLPAPGLDQGFTICHLGSMNRDRNPHALWQALARLQRAQHPLLSKLRVTLLGAVDNEVVKTVASLGLKNHVELAGFISHELAIERMRASQVLLLPINRTANAAGVIPGKFFEYLGARRPILLIGPPAGDAASLVQQCEAGEVLDFDDVDGVEQVLLNWYQRYEADELYLGGGAIDAYSRRALAEQYAGLLNELIGNHTGSYSPEHTEGLVNTVISDQRGK